MEVGQKRRFSIVVIAVIVVIFSVIWIRNQTTENSMPIRIATMPWPGYELLYLAEKKGFFEDEGVPVQLIRFSALEDSRRAYERGQVDAMAVTIIELLQAHDNGYPSKIILIADSAKGEDIIIARKGINSIKDLKGKRVAVEPPFSVYALFLILQKAGLKLNDVKMVNTNQLKMQAALFSDRVDAVHTFAPYSTEILRHKDMAGKIFRVPDDVIDIISIKPEIITRRPKDIRALRRAWDRAVIYSREHPEEANLIMAKAEQVSPHDFFESRKNLKALSLDDQRLFQQNGSLEKGIIDVGAVLSKIGQIKGPISPDLLMAEIKDAPNAHNN